MRVQIPMFGSVLTDLLFVFHCRAPAPQFPQSQIPLQHLASQVRRILDPPLLFVSAQSARELFWGKCAENCAVSQRHSSSPYLAV